jgi:Uri superfamily endonuclease
MIGIYVLEISVGRNISVEVGKLGSVNFAKGLYVYVGSAQNNLEKRVKRHLSKQKKTFWHIDYLLANKHVTITGVFFKSAEKSEECGFAAEMSKSSLPMTGFGSSDCKCTSHLYKLRGAQFLRQYITEKQWCPLGHGEVK